MKVVQISYAQLLNLGNFENVRLEWTAELEPGDNPAVATRQLALRVRAALSEQAKPAAAGPSPWAYQDDDGGTIP